MTTKIEILWKEILESAKSKPIANDSYVLRRIDHEHRFDIYAGVDASGFLLLAVGIGSPPPSIQLNTTALDYFRAQRTDGTWLMALRLRQGMLAAVFGRLCQDLIDLTTTMREEGELVALFRERLSLWKRLFENTSEGLLAPHSVKGLIAELLTLEKMLLDGTRQPPEVVNAWVGPLGADQDFLFQDQAVEVKSVAPHSEGVSISSLQQLAASVSLCLNVHTMRQASIGEIPAIDLNALARRVESRLAPFPDAVLLFKERLLAAGYVDNAHYDTLPFQVLKQENFEVTDEFPKLTPNLVPKGVISATYVLALEKLRELKDERFRIS